MTEIVIGVDGSPGAATALRWAAREVLTDALRGANLNGLTGPVEQELARANPASAVLDAAQVAEHGR